MKTFSPWISFLSLVVAQSQELSLVEMEELSRARESSGPAGSPIPKPFPEIFQIDFVTNITWDEYEDNIGGAIQSSYKTAISARLYYDWTHNRQRIDHGPGSYECQHFYDHDGPCSLIFVPGWGMYRILTGDGADHGKKTGISSPSFTCCLDIPNISTPPPDWAELGNPTYNGIVYDKYSNRIAHEWVYNNVTAKDYTIFPGGRRFRRRMDTRRLRLGHPRQQRLKGAKPQNGTLSVENHAAEAFHTTRQALGDSYDGRPVLFTFPSAGGRQDYHYLVETMQELDHMDTSTFDLPDGCLRQFCKCHEVECLSYATD